MATEMMVEIDSSRDINRDDFPKDFVFGVGSSAYQVEGSWNADGKGLSIWDSFCLQHPEKIKGGTNACQTVEGYLRMKEDVQLLKKMGVNSYRFSISWSRILPDGKVTTGKSIEGIDHYNKLIDELLANDIEPFVTLFHWDLPNALEEEYMGFLSSKVVDDFVNYADICFWEFGDRVKNWVTLNEPHRFAYDGYVKGASAPGRGVDRGDGDAQTEPYTVAYNLLNCHAAVYRKYCQDYKDAQKGRVGITLNSTYYLPYRATYPQDVEAVKYALDFETGWFLEPITSGSWPESMLTFAQAPTRDYPNGRVLPKFSTDQRTKLIDSYDFLGVNYYTSNYARQPTSSDVISLGYSTDSHYVGSGQDPEGHYIGQPSFKGSWVYLCPQQLTELLVYIKRTYNVTKDIIITENGSSDKNEPGKTYEQMRDDQYRITYIKEHLKAIKNARDNKKVNVTGYFVWSFMDSFEWYSGYTARFGMIYVDYLNDLKRYPKQSALWYKKFLSTKEKHWPWIFKRSITASEEGNNHHEVAHKEEKVSGVSQKPKKART